MKTIKLIFVAVLVFVTLGLIGWGQESGARSDDSGKVIGQIINPSSIKPVKEKFIVSVFFFKENGRRYAITPMDIIKGENINDSDFSLLTDENGYFSAVFPIGNYNISIYPSKKNSIYCEEPSFEGNGVKYAKKYDFKIRVEKGKITKFARKATLGGKVKVLLVNPSGNPIDPRTAFWRQPLIKVSMDCNVSNRPHNGSMETAELILSSIFPEIYGMTVDIKGFGQTKITKEDIVVRAGEITEVRLVLDPHDNTGVEGYVFDKNGIPVNSADVCFVPKDPKGASYICIGTDTNGYFRLTGMLVGRYEVFISGENLRLEANIFIEVKKGVLLRLDLRSKFSSK